MWRALAASAAVVALLAPATAALADEPVTSTIEATNAVVYPAVDGYLDSTRFYGWVDLGSYTGAAHYDAVVTRGAQMAAGWTGFVEEAWPIDLPWNGRLHNSVVAGAYTFSIVIRGDDGTVLMTQNLPVTVSAKKLTVVTTTYTQLAAAHYNCWDDKFVEGVSAQLKYFDKICRLNYSTSPFHALPLSTTIRGTVSEGPVNFLGIFLNKPASSVNSAFGPVILTVKATFSQTGEGSNSFYVCETDGCMEPSDATLVTFSKSGTYTTTGMLATTIPRWPAWRVVVDHGHNLTVKKFTYTLTRRVLK
jgi:hypothetical protein